MGYKQKDEKLSLLKNYLRNSPFFWPLSRSIYRWFEPIFTHPLSCWGRYIRFFSDWRKYQSSGGNARFLNFYPCLHDKTSQTKFDPQYFYQAAWAASEIYRSHPLIHVDVASDVKFVGVLSAITKVKFVDIRPLEANLRNLECISGSILELPFKSESVESLSTLHVIEHIGLGRYGDPIDPNGAQKASKELIRVLSVGGHLYLSIPIGSPRVQFNGLRTFSPLEVLELFKDLKLITAAYVDNHGKYYENVDITTVEFDEKRGADFALGCFMFLKEVTTEIE
ncbi:MAG: DUF268 domain-containing protein [Methylotenera sp.]